MIWFLLACSTEPPPPAPPEPVPLDWAGTDTCVGCHPEQGEAWTGSHHDLALQEPTAALAPFTGSAEGGGDEATFSRDGNQLSVTTATADGSATVPVAWTFGVEPVQQYLVEQPGGSFHALPWLWDTRSADAGGQRWHHLYAGDEVPPGDPLHWAGRQHRWNHSCAACHSTGVVEGYADGTYDTTFAEPDVGCEACHGQGSRHVAWARDEGGERDLIPLSEPGTWVMEDDGIAAREPGREGHTEIDTCGRCHSRRTALVEGPAAGAPLLDTHRPAVLEAPLYQADGQILDEVFVWGSFLQSRMYAAGVTCSDCHDPHSGDLVAPGNETCTQCHDARYDRTEHHHHPDGQACVDCHAPARTYMQVDDRRDHSFRVPRPDLAVSLGVDEPCTRCHDDQDAAWAAGQISTWGVEPQAHYGEALHAGRTGAPEGHDALIALLASEAPEIARATAASLLPRYPSARSRGALHNALDDDDPLVRREAATALPGDPAVAPLLEDPVRGVRIAAAWALIGQVPMTSALREAAREAEASEHTDTPEGLLARATLDLARGSPALAERQLRRAVALEPRFAPGWVNLAEALRPDDALAIRILDEGLSHSTGHPDLLHARGLARVRTQDREGALDDLWAAAAAAPDNARYAYVHAVALSEQDPAGALAAAKSAYARHPGDLELLGLLEHLGDDATWRARRQEDAPWSVSE